MSDEPDLDTARRQGDVCGLCARPSVYRHYVGAGEVEAACAEHAHRLRGGKGPPAEVALRGDVRQLVARHGLGAVLQEVARQVTLDLSQQAPAPEPERLRPPDPGTGTHQRFSADPAVFDSAWLHDRYLTGSHGMDATCRSCRATFELDYDSGDWVGWHAEDCPTGHEPVPWETGQ